MSEKNISISPYAKADNVIDIKGFIKLDDLNDQIEIPEKKHLNLYNFSTATGDLIVPRNFKTLHIILKPNWISNYTQNDLDHLLLKGESSHEILKLRLQVWCKNTRWCSEQVAMLLRDVNNKNEIIYEIPLCDVKEEVVISGFITREKVGRKSESRKADAIFSVLSNCEDISIQIDEKRDIGGNYLPIQPDNIGELLFDVQGMENDFELPVIKYSEDFKPFFVKDNIKTVNVTFMMSMFYFLDSYLKWLIFKCKYDSHDKNQKGLIEIFSKYCDISKNSLIEIVEDKKYSETQTKEYLRLSLNLFKGIQKDSPVKYSKELKQLIKDETK
ncbi:MAG: hypothetical protein K0S32_1541 [Bacteroidetes bacterium]|jgi:hypothetical protein|nr:hypothetical protein [Bacteroidota bacterium]